MANLPYVINSMNVVAFLILFALVVAIPSVSITVLVFMITRHVYIRRRMPIELAKRIDLLEKKYHLEVTNHIVTSGKLTRLRTIQKAARTALEMDI